ncbi:LysM peptidoglycan-binding domain-containing protein [Vitreoscilla massiliensis]|uniref:LysM peptidoglycan-binding domain-containing protein n=1 Tax=Vitreoscilla massiliensis TaxID=1689272 RepID=A0ABY4E5C9_9NEIS|nr:LysM peptidoglycan-binding domain-containing protein [Vitreoscilla massiliensis]UOO88632.1 LysM peptidoglycan-binding domain-containing protein [Vitreoscilla massiliensis]
MTHFKNLLLALTSVTVSHAVIAQTVTTPFEAQKVAHDLMRLNSGLLFGQNQKFGDIFSRIGSRFEMTEVNPELVRQHERKFTRDAAYMNRTISRSQPYLHYVATEVERRNMPGEIALLPYIESAFVIKAKSPVGASGLWQFMPATGKQYGLEQNNVYDGRHDVYASTDAALNYLEYLYGLFGDWSLALAAYNWGEGNVARAVKRTESQGLLPTYENLKMPQETRNYAPKLLAWRNIVANPAAFGLNIPKIEDDAYFEALDVSTPIDTSQAARLAGISQEEFNRLNPGFNLPVFIPTAKRKMLLPKNAVNHFVRNYQASDVNQLLSYNLYTPMSGEKVQDVAASFGMSDSELKQINGIRSNVLNAGTPVLVAKNRPVNTNPAAGFTQTSFTGEDSNLAFAVPAVTPRQADVLSKPKAQLAQAAPLKIRASRAQPMIQQNFVAKSEIRSFTAPADDLVGQTALAAVEKHANTPVVTAASFERPVSTPVQMASNAIKTTVVSTPTVVSTVTRVQAAPIQVAANTIQSETIQANAAAQTLLNNSVAKVERAAVSNSFAAQAAENDAVNLMAATKTAAAPVRAQAVVETDPLLALMNKGNSVAAPVAVAVAAPTPAVSSQIAQTNTVDANFAANAVREAIAREDAKEAREMERLAKLRNDNEKRERQLANATQHKVGSGDTLYSIAKTYDMSVSELLAANGLNDNNIKVGQTLVVGKAADRAIQTAKAKEQKQQANMNYVVRKGDTLNSIAGKFNLKVNDLRKWNNGNNIKPGQKIQLRQL